MKHEKGTLTLHFHSHDVKSLDCLKPWTLYIHVMSRRIMNSLIFYRFLFFISFILLATISYCAYIYFFLFCYIHTLHNNNWKYIFLCNFPFSFPLLCIYFFYTLCLCYNVYYVWYESAKEQQEISIKTFPSSITI